MRKCANISPYLRRPFLKYDFATAPFWISLYVYEENLIFFFISVATASEVISPEIHVPISRVEIPQALCQIEGFPATRPTLKYKCIFRNIFRKWIGNFPDICNGYEQLRDVTHTVFMQRWGSGRVRWFLYICSLLGKYVEHDFEQRFVSSFYSLINWKYSWGWPKKWICKGYGTTYRCNTYYILYLCKGGGRGQGEMLSIYFALCFESKVEHYFKGTVQRDGSGWK